MGAHPVLNFRSSRRGNKNLFLRLLPFAVIILSMACALPFGPAPVPTKIQRTSTPTEPPIPSPTPQAVAPALVESDPPLNGETPLNGPITLYFNQAMDRASVEAGLVSELGAALAFTWVDDSTVIVFLNETLQPEQTVSLNLGDTVRSRGGKPLLQPIRLDYKAAGYLRLAQTLPSPGAENVDPSAAIVAAFTRPVVALGAEPAKQPDGFTLEPPAAGRGEWLNTSTYIFYPQPALAGGQNYTMRINPQLQSTDGGPLKLEADWTFSTAQPALVKVEPGTESPWPLDPQVRLTFNQPMDPASVQANFLLISGDGQVMAGESAWEENNTVFIFTPQSLLGRSTVYQMQLNNQTLSAGGSPITGGIDYQVVTAPALMVERVEPGQGQEVDPNGSLSVLLSAPLTDDIKLEDYVSLSPAVAGSSFYYDAERQAVGVYAPFAARTSYMLRISGSLPDQWGGKLGEDYIHSFVTGPLPPNLNVVSAGMAVFMTTQDSGLTVQAANLTQAPLTLGSMTLGDFFTLSGPDSYDQLQSYTPANAVSFSAPLNLSPDQTQTTQISLLQGGGALGPGLYFLRFNFEQEGIPNVYAGPFLVVVSDVQLTLKVGADQALVWAVDLRTNQPVADAPVTIYNERGEVIAQGRTDAQGVFVSPIAVQKDAYSTVYAVINQQGEAQFSLTATGWNAGIDPWSFGLQQVLRAPGPHIYFYTDRPIYRPGDTVSFRAIVRQAFNGRYTPPEIANLPVMIYGPEGLKLADLTLTLDGYGSAHGVFDLPADATPGNYSLTSDVDQNAQLAFDVADYRKPEINLQTTFAQLELQSGQELSANFSARYFFDAPAGNLKLHWALYSRPGVFELPGYHVGLEDTSWMEPFFMPGYFGGFGDLVKEGDLTLDANGQANLNLPTQPANQALRYTLEATLVDESGLSVSARAELLAHPDSFYIGVRPDAWAGRATEPLGFDIQTVDRRGEPAPAPALRGEFKQVQWVKDEEKSRLGLVMYKPQYTPVGSVDFTTGVDEGVMGRARLQFTAPQPGTYMLEVFNPQNPSDQGARTQALVWMGGPGQAIWPNIPNSRLKLTPNQDSYRPGDTAQVFIPNPFGQPVPSLVTVERAAILAHQVITLPAEGYLFSLPLTDEHAPNVYVSVTALGRSPQGVADFRLGYQNLLVEPVAQKINVSVVGEPPRAGPGDTIAFTIQVADAAGQPVQAEFSLAVVDLAALALADPNSPPIAEAFYGMQPLGIRTSLSLAAYPRRMLDMPGGLGGGGGAEAISVARENFPDTAYWNAEIVTDAGGKAEVSVTLPDTLTTWQVDARGISQSSLVGEAAAQIITTKDLLVRPVTPRFLVVGDHVEMAAVVQNNTANPLRVDVTLQANGFILDVDAAQSVDVPANGRARVAWWGTAQDADHAALVFSANGGGLQDAARPPLGDLPILHYLAPQTFRTAGVLNEGGQQTELISLPRSYQAQGGSLNVELSPSLAAAMLRALDAIDQDSGDSTEAVVSSFLPNLETYRTLQSQGLDDPQLKARLDEALNRGLQRLAARQNADGGWGWLTGEDSSELISTYALFGLTRAKDAGVSINQNMLQQAVKYLQSSTPQTTGDGGWQADRSAFRQYVLALNGAANPEILTQLRSQAIDLSPWAKALLAQAIDITTPGDGFVTQLLDEIAGSAQRAATGAWWQLNNAAGRAAPLSGLNMQDNLSNSAVVLFILAQRDPASPLAADAMRYLMTNRQANGGWSSSYQTAWALLAMNEWLKGAGPAVGGYAFSAALNGAPIAQGQAQGPTAAAVTSQTPIQKLYPDAPNMLTIQRDGSGGRLFYTVGLLLSRPADQVSPYSSQLSLSRAITAFGESCVDQPCSPITQAQAGNKVTVRLSLALPHDMYYLRIEDFIPAGAEIIDTRLKTTQQGMEGQPQVQLYDPRNPFSKGWGWWNFSEPRIYDDHIAWQASYLPAGSYELTYTLALLQPGQFRLLPARAWQIYFPEIYANSAGGLFEITGR